MIFETLSGFNSLLISYTNLETAIIILTTLCFLGFIAGKIKYITPMILFFTGVCYLLILTGRERSIITNEEFNMLSTVFCGAGLVCGVSFMSSFLRIIKNVFLALVNFRRRDERTNYSMH